MRRLALLSILCAAFSSAAPAAAREVATSSRPDRVAVTVYRDPERSADDGLNLDWLQGYALISEVRTVRIPAGEVDIRFEGVAGNIMPQSAIITGLGDVLEKNQDALLLSPGALIEAALGRRVHLRRTSQATGAVREHEAIVRSGAEGAVVLQTAEGFEALRCSGLSETLVYDRVPSGLSARPVLSVRTRARRAITATVTLSYLASGFDWQANYVANLSADGSRVDLFAWVTLASGDETSFVAAATQAVAGRVYHQPMQRSGRWGGGINLSCWPQGTTSDIANVNLVGGEDIVVTGSRVPQAMGAPPPPPPAPVMARMAMEAQQEELGDLKLYRIPEPVTVASRSQKQVAFLQRADVPVEIVYRADVGRPGADWAPAQRLLVTRNRTESRLGVPLPAGRMVLFASGRERPILIGEGSIDDRAVGEDVEVELGTAPGVLVQVVRTPEGQLVTVSNDQDRPVRFEGEIAAQDVDASAPLGRRNGRNLWTVTVPANDRAILTYRTR